MFFGEQLAKAVQKLLTEYLDSRLVVIGTLWIDDPVELGTVKEWRFGHQPTIVEQPFKSFPIVAIMTTGSEPVDNPDQMLGMFNEYSILVDMFVADSDETKVNKKLMRFCQAAIDVLQSEHKLEHGRLKQGIGIEVTEVMRQMEPQKNIEFFTQMGRLILRVER